MTFRLAGLHFFCHRPTVSALMSLGADVSALNDLLATEQQVRGKGCVCVLQTCVSPCLYGLSLARWGGDTVMIVIVIPYTVCSLWNGSGAHKVSHSHGFTTTGF